MNDEQNPACNYAVIYLKFNYLYITNCCVGAVKESNCQLQMIFVLKKIVMVKSFWEKSKHMERERERDLTVFIVATAFGNKAHALCSDQNHSRNSIFIAASEHLFSEHSGFDQS